MQKKSEGPVDSVRIDKYDYGYKAGTQFVMVSGEFLASASDVDHNIRGVGPFNLSKGIVTSSAPWPGVYMKLDTASGWRCARTELKVKRLLTGEISNPIKATNTYGSCGWT